MEDTALTGELPGLQDGKQNKVEDERRWRREEKRAEKKRKSDVEKGGPLQHFAHMNVMHFHLWRKVVRVAEEPEADIIFEPEKKRPERVTTSCKETAMTAAIGLQRSK